MRIFSYFFKFVRLQQQKKKKIWNKWWYSDSYYLVKRLVLRLYNLDKNYRSYCLKSLTVELYFSYIFFSNELFAQTFKKFLMDKIVYRKTCQFQNWAITSRWPMLAEREIIIFLKNTNITRLLVVVQKWN